LGGAVPGYIVDVYPKWDEDFVGHGTHVSGIIAAMRNAKGVIGVSPEGSNLFQ
jgi:major intracellular serine protease